MKFSVPALFPGQEVAVQNSTHRAKVVRRVGPKNGQVVYEVKVQSGPYQGQVHEVARANLGVRIHDRFVFGPAITTDVQPPIGAQPPIKLLQIHKPVIRELVRIALNHRANGAPRKEVDLLLFNARTLARRLSL